MILTSNLTFGSWDQACAGDPVLTAAMLDRAAPLDNVQQSRRELPAQGQAPHRTAESADRHAERAGTRQNPGYPGGYRGSSRVLPGHRVIAAAGWLADSAALRAL